MGYRSEVYIKIDTKYNSEFKFLLGVHEIDYLSIAYSNNEYTCYEGNGLKWYTGYKDVDAVNNFVDTRENCALVAIGEDEEISAEFGDLEATGIEIRKETYIEGF